MLIRLYGTEFFIDEAFYNQMEQPDDMGLDILNATRTQLVIRNAANGAVTTFTGRDLPTAAQLENESFPGVITGWSTVDSQGRNVATVTGIDWLLFSFVQGLDQLFGEDRADILFNLINQQQSFTIDASRARGEQQDLVLDGLTRGATIIGSQFGDWIQGGSGNDTIRPGGAPVGQGDRIFASPGNDRIEFTGVSSASWIELIYGPMNDPITATINGPTNTGTITAGDKTDTLFNVRDILAATDGGLHVAGTRGNDTFNINPGAGSWMQVSGGQGNDTYNVTLTGMVRLNFFGYPLSEDEWVPNTQGIVVNLRTGVISNDGFGGTDQVNILGDDGRLSIRGTDLADSIQGGDRNEVFILEGGNDTLDGGGGRDEVRYDRPGYQGGVTVDLTENRATGIWNGQSFTHTIRNIDEVRGSAGNDLLVGNARDNRLEGRAGSDTLISGAGNDSLYGGAGADTFIVSAGGSTLIGDFNPSQDRIDLRGWAGLEAINQLNITNTANGGLRVAFGSEVLTIVGEQGGLTAASLTTANLIGLRAEGEASPLPSHSDEPGPDDIVGLPGVNQVIEGTDGDDRIFAGSGNNRLLGGEGDDTLYAGAGGNDTLDGGPGNNVLVGNTGNDRFIVRSPGDLVINELGYSQQGGINTVMSWIDYSVPRNIQILRLQGEEDLRGYGGWAPEALVGNAGNNWLDGGPGNDVLNGKDGDDTLVGGMGADSLVGEAGADVFLFRSIAESRPGQENRDFINGFFREEGDKIDLSEIDANTTLAGNQAFTFIGSRGFSGQAGELRWFTWGGNNYNIVEADVDGDRQADFQIFINLTDHMVQSDFIL